MYDSTRNYRRLKSNSACVEMALFSACKSLLNSLLKRETCSVKHVNLLLQSNLAPFSDYFKLLKRINDILFLGVQYFSTT